MRLLPAVCSTRLASLPAWRTGPSRLSEHDPMPASALGAMAA